jgi:protein-L-isoaspartate(D-aspartate) O-methyltransferase
LALVLLFAVWSGRVAGEGAERTAFGTGVRRLPGPGEDSVRPSAQEAAVEDWPDERAEMVAALKVYNVRDARVLAAISRVRRHVFIPEAFRSRSTAYGDFPCPIGHGQTISQPFIVAYMTERMAVLTGEKVLEIGTGSAYQAAVLAELGAEVYSMEIIPALAEHARQVLKAEGYDERVRVKTGDGYQGWPVHQPFDVVIVTCAPAEVPEALVEQLREGGRMIVPVGEGSQRLVILRKEGGRVQQESDLGVRFVTMVRGRA